jgi:hypothetical protein
MTATEKPRTKRFSGLTIALVVLCVVFIVATIGVTAYYVPLTNNKNLKISSLNSQISSLNSQIGNLNSIIGLQQSTVWMNNKTVSQRAFSWSTWTFSASNAGYVVVHILNSTADIPIDLEATYSSHGYNYSQAWTGSQSLAWKFAADGSVISAGSSVIFPILPSNVTIGVSNENFIGYFIPIPYCYGIANETVTITYYY